jgi:uncharacterized protein YeeX (DUF496 family)
MINQIWTERFVSETRCRTITDPLTALTIALFCCDADTSLMLIQAINDVTYCNSVIPLLMGEESNKKNNIFYHCYYVETTYSTYNHTPREDAHTEKEIKEFGPSGHQVFRRDPKVQKQLFSEAKKIRNTAQALLLLEQHLATLDANYQMIYSTIGNNKILSLLKSYWKERINQAQTLVRNLCHL